MYSCIYIAIQASLILHLKGIQCLVPLTYADSRRKPQSRGRMALDVANYSLRSTRLMHCGECYSLNIELQVRYECSFGLYAFPKLGYQLSILALSWKPDLTLICLAILGPPFLRPRLPPWETVSTASGLIQLSATQDQQLYLVGHGCFAGPVLIWHLDSRGGVINGLLKHHLEVSRSVEK